MSISSCLQLPFPVIQSATSSFSTRRSLNFLHQNASCLGYIKSLRQRRHKVLRPRTTATCFSRKPAESTVPGQGEEIDQEKESQEYELERLFSNLNQVTLKREPGSLSSAIFLVAGTTIGAGILAIPAVTQESGFLASAITCTFCWVYMVVTGLLIAEVNVNTMCELGSGGVSLVSMAMRTLGKVGVQVSCWSYILIHYALLVAYVARSSGILANFLGIPLYERGVQPS